MAEESSEFGRGLCYNLGLFLAHAERLERDKALYERAGLSHGRTPEMWFYASTDHLQELQVDLAPESLRERLNNFVERCFYWRLHREGQARATEADVMWALDEAKELLRAIDEAHGVPTSKAQWA